MTTLKIPDDIERWEKKGLREDIDTDAEHVHDIYIWHNYAIEHEKCDCGGDYKDKGHWNPYAIVDGHPVKLNRDFFDSFEEAVGYLKAMIKDKAIVDGEEADDEDEDEPEIPKHPDGDTVARKGFDMRVHMAMMNGEEGAREAYSNYIHDLKRSSIKPTEEEKDIRKIEGAYEYRGDNAFEVFTGKDNYKGPYQSHETNTPKYNWSQTSVRPEGDEEKPTEEELAKKSPYGITEGFQTQTQHPEHSTSSRQFPITPEKRNRQYQIRDDENEKKRQDDIRIVAGDETADVLDTARNNKWDYAHVSDRADKLLDPNAGVKFPVSGEWIPEPEHELPDTPNGLTPEEAQIWSDTLKQQIADELGWTRRDSDLPLLNENSMPTTPEITYPHGFKDGIPKARVSVAGNPEAVMPGSRQTAGTQVNANDHNITGKTTVSPKAGYTPELTLWNKILGIDTKKWLGDFKRGIKGIGRNVRSDQEDNEETQEESRVEPWEVRVGNRIVPTLRAMGWAHDVYPDMDATLAMLTAYNKLALEKNPHITPIYKEDREATIDDLKNMSPAQMRHMFIQMSQYTDPDTGEVRWDGKHVPILAGYQYGKMGKDGTYATLEKKGKMRKDGTFTRLKEGKGKKKGELNPGFLAMIANDIDTEDRHGMGIYKNANDIATYKYGGVMGARPAADVYGHEDDYSHVYGKQRQIPYDMIEPLFRDVTNMMNGDDPKFRDKTVNKYIFNHFKDLNPARKKAMERYLQLYFEKPATEEDAIQRKAAMRSIEEGYRENQDSMYGGISFEDALKTYMDHVLGNREWYSDAEDADASDGSVRDVESELLKPYMDGTKASIQSREAAREAWAREKMKEAKYERLVDMAEPYVMHWLDNMSYKDAQELFAEYPQLRRNMAMSPEERMEWYSNLFNLGDIRNNTDSVGTAARTIKDWQKTGEEGLGKQTKGMTWADWEKASSIRDKPISTAELFDSEKARRNLEAFGRAIGLTPAVSDTGIGKSKKDLMRDRIQYFDPYFDTLMNKGDEEGGEKKVDGMPSGEHDSNPRKATYRTVSMGEGKDASWPMKVVDKNTGKVLFTLGDRD